MMSIRISAKQSLCSIAAISFLVGCTSTTPPSLPSGNPADPQVRVPAKAPNNLLVHDDTTVAIEKELSQTESAAKSAESMQHMGHGDMPGMQHGDMKMDDHQDTPSANVESEKKAVADEMTKTSEEMKKTSEKIKQKSEQTKSQDFYYTCRMHPQIHADKPGKCPICGMTLIKKEGESPK